MNQKIKKNGFTLIELLAVIVILAIISLIAVPIIIQIVQNTKEKAFKSSVNGVVKAVENYMATEEIDNVTITYPLYLDFSDDLSDTIDYSGKKMIAGIISIDENGQMAISNLTDGTYCAEKEFTETDISVAKMGDAECLAYVSEQLSNIDITNEFSELETTISTLETVISGLETSITGLQDENEGLQTSITSLQTSITNLQNENDEMSSELDEKTTELDNMYLHNHPNTWVVGTEYDFGGGVYGQRFTGKITNSAGRVWTTIGNLPLTIKFQKYGGNYDSGNGGIVIIGEYQISASSSTTSASSVTLSPTTGNVGLVTHSSIARDEAPYDVWVTYTKTST